MLLDIYFYFLILLVPLFSQIIYTATDYRTPKYFILAIFVFGLAILNFIKTLRDRKLNFFATPAHLLWLIFSMLSFVSTINVLRDRPLFFRRSLDVAFYLFMNVFLSFVLSTVVSKKERLTKYLFVFSITGTVVAANAVLNYYTSYDIFLGVVEGLFYRDRMKSTIGNVVFVSNYLATLLPITLYFTFTKDLNVAGVKGKKGVFIIKLFSLLNAVLIAFTLALAQVRTDFASLFLAAIVVIALFLTFKYSRSHAKKDVAVEEADQKIAALSKVNKVFLVVLLASFATIFFVVFMIPSPVNYYKDAGGSGIELGQRFRTAAVGKDFDRRLVAWLGAIEIWKKHKIIGQGIGSFQVFGVDAIAKVVGSRPELNYAWQPFDTVHNDYLQVLSETGLTGLSVIAALLLYLALFAFNNVRKIVNGDDLLLFSGLVGGSAVVLAAMTLNPLGIMPPNALLANFLISSALSRCMNKVGGRTYTFVGKSAIVLASTVLLLVVTGTAFRSLRFLSQFYEARAMVAYEFINLYDNQLKELQERVREAGDEESKSKILEEIRNVSSERDKAYEKALWAFDRSLRFDHTAGQAMFYLTALTHDEKRVDALAKVLPQHYREILNQDFDVPQKLIPAEKKRKDLTFLIDEIESDESLLRDSEFTSNLAKAQASLDSIALFYTALELFPEPHTRTLLQRRYQVLSNALERIAGRLSKESTKRKTKELVEKYFDAIVSEAMRLYETVFGVWTVFNKYKNLDVQLATVSGEDMHRSTANYMILARGRWDEKLHGALIEVAKKETEICLNVERSGGWGIPLGVLPYLCGKAVAESSAGNESEAKRLVAQVVDLYSEPYEWISRKVSSGDPFRRSADDFIEIVVKRLRLSIDRVGWKLNVEQKEDFLKIVRESLQRKLDDFFSYDFGEYAQKFFEELTVLPLGEWPFNGMKSVWRDLVEPVIRELSFAVLSTTGSLELFGEVSEILAQAVDSRYNLSLFMYESYSIFTKMYEYINKRFGSAYLN